MRLNSASCDCVDIVYATVPEGDFFEFSSLTADVLTKVELNLDSMVTFRESGVAGVFTYNIHQWVPDSCLTLVDTPYKDSYYAQMTLKATTADCRFAYSFGADVETTPTFMFEFIVWPSVQPESQGELYTFDTMDFDTLVEPISVAADASITFRMIEQPGTGYAWTFLTTGMDCFELVDDNFGGFNTGW
jgi:hypothetical protein